MVWAVSRPVLLVTPVSILWHDDDADFDFDDNERFDDFDQVMGLATIKRGGAPALQVEGGDQQNNDDNVDAHGDDGDGDKTEIKENK